MKANLLHSDCECLCRILSITREGLQVQTSKLKWIQSDNNCVVLNGECPMKISCSTLLSMLVLWKLLLEVRCKVSSTEPLQEERFLMGVHGNDINCSTENVN